MTDALSSQDSKVLLVHRDDRGRRLYTEHEPEDVIARMARLLAEWDWEAVGAEAGPAHVEQATELLRVALEDEPR